MLKAEQMPFYVFEWEFGGKKRKIALQLTQKTQNAKKIFKNSILCTSFPSSYSEQ